LPYQAPTEEGFTKMLRIEPVETSSGHCLLRLEGEVVGPWVEEIRRSCEPARAAGAKLTLDLADVAFVDRDGVELFRGLMQAGVVVLNCSPFVQSQLGTGQGEATPWTSTPSFGS